jgi:phospholipase/carboxylesterase
MLDTKFYPAGKSDSKALMVVLHGLGDSAAGYHWVPGVLDLPWMNYLLVNAPDQYYGGFSWFDFAGDFRPGVERSRKLLLELLDDQRAKGFPTRETTLFGFSQGCLMTIDVGLRYPHKFAGLVGISGFVFEPQELLRELSPVVREQRLLVTHGTADTMVPLQHTEPAIKLLKSAGINVEWHVLEKDHTIAGQEEMEIIRRFIEAGYR